MAEQPRDWNKEMAAIDKVMAKQPIGAPAPAPSAGARALPAGPAAAAPAMRHSLVVVWLKLLLAVGLAVALPFWPYPRSCGLNLFFYLGGVGAALLVGVWAGHATWHRRAGFGHLLALLSTLAALGYATAEALPRLGYAKQPAAWICPAAPTPLPTAPSTPPSTPPPTP